MPRKQISRLKEHRLIGVYPTGLEGNLSHDHKPSALYNRSNIKFTLGAPWKVRWDYDAGKESHVNVEIGKGPNRLKFAFIAETSSTRDRQGVEPYYSAIKQAQQAVNWNENCRTDSDASRLIAWWSARFHKPRWNVYSTEEPYQ
jgi:hypothetical protein